MRFNARCARCVYGRELGEAETMCEYAGIEGKTRLAQVYEELGVREMTSAVRELMKPENCSFFRGNGKNGGHGGRHPKSKRIDWDKAAELHARGMTTGQIAAAIGVADGRPVLKWLRRTGRKPNPYTARRIDWDKLETLYAQGLTDAEIAVELGCHKDSVRLWRHIQGYYANRGKEAKE